MNRRSISLVVRAVLTLCLMAGFYCLAIVMVIGLLYLPYAEVVYANRLHIKLVIFSLSGALIILWSLVPRRDQFHAPGPLLVKETQPTLFEAISSVAVATRQRMPREIYLVLEVNAWVAQRGGILGLGSRRVMGLGLPLLTVLSVSELRAVLAHEFGHFHGGDTKLGRWVYQTRAAIARTLINLTRQESILHLPFFLYAQLFLLVSHAVSRSQELVADRLAAQTVGARALAEGLLKIHGAAAAFETYWSDQVLPVLDAGYQPPLAAGFQRFTHGPLGAPAMATAMNQALMSSPNNLYDTHPPLSERLTALRELPKNPPDQEDAPAVTLLGDLQNLELALLRPPIAAARRPLPQQIAWEEVGVRVYSCLWETAAAAHRGLAFGRTFGELSARARDIVETIAAILVRDEPRLHSNEERKLYAIWILGAAIASALARSGWEVNASPAERVVVRGPKIAVDPFETARDLVSGALDMERWHRFCDEAGIAGLAVWPDAPVSDRVESGAPSGAPAVVPLPTRSASGAMHPKCWKCKEMLSLVNEKPGKKVRCPRCGTRQEMPR